ncbi:MAG: FMN-binding protein [Brevinematia bacterium]
MLRAFKIIYPLVVIGVGVGFLLSFTYQSLEKRLIEAKNREEMIALKQLFPDASDFKKLEIEGEEYYEAVGENTGYIFKRANTGYGGPVEALIAITNGFVANIVVTSMAKETPGLGSKVAYRNWLKQFLGKGVNEIPSTKTEFKEKGIDAVSGATFSSLAICRDIIDAFKTYKKLGFIVNESDIDGETKATKEE